MAVLVRRAGRRGRTIGRALARHGVPVVATTAFPPDEPVVRAVVDMLRWVGGDDHALDRLLVSPLARLAPLDVRAIRREAAAAGGRVEDDPRVARLVALRHHLRRRLAAGDTPADLAYETWARGLAHAGTGLGAVDDRALDGLVALIEGLARTDARGTTLADALAALAEGDLTPDPWRARASAGTDGVTILPIEAAAGREWHTVVVAGCVEGELPSVRRGTPLFDPARLHRDERRPPAAAPAILAAERRLFAIATSRASTTLLATAAPEPGVLLSRFVEAWPPPDEPFGLPHPPGLAVPVRPVTAGPAPIAPEGQLVLSATQLDTYDDCPLRYAYQYVMRARDEPGVHAGLGSLVHEVLAAFLDPAAEDPPDRTLDGLLHLADRHWRDDIARYRPQAEEARRDFVAMLTDWWEAEGSRPELAESVVAVERPFDIGVGPHRLVGKIDRIDRVDSGVGLRVIDYKTGKSEPRAADVADDLQLAVYHLAATRDPELAELGTPTQLELRYLRSMHTYRQPVVEDHAARTEARVLAVAERILAEEFEPSVDANCRTCSFHRLCPLQPEGRQVGVET
jgi:RecB family exonuclease